MWSYSALPWRHRRSLHNDSEHWDASIYSFSRFAESSNDFRAASCQLVGDWQPWRRLVLDLGRDWVRGRGKWSGSTVGEEGRGWEDRNSLSTKDWQLGEKTISDEATRWWLWAGLARRHHLHKHTPRCDRSDQNSSSSDVFNSLFFFLFFENFQSVFFCAKKKIKKVLQSSDRPATKVVSRWKFRKLFSASLFVCCSIEWCWGKKNLCHFSLLFALSATTLFCFHFDGVRRTPPVNERGREVAISRLSTQT